MQKPEVNDGLPASALIDKRIAELDDWRGQALSRMRQLIRKSRLGLPPEAAFSVLALTQSEC